MKLQIRLSEFAKEHGLSDAQLTAVLSDLVLNEQKLKKGGVGVIDAKTFIVVDESRNAMFISDKRWDGKPADEMEVALSDDQRVLGSVPITDLSHLRIVIFSPAEIRFIDLSNNTGGRYLRAEGPRSP